MKKNLYLLVIIFIISAQSLLSYWTPVNTGIDSTELNLCNPILIDDILYAGSIGDYISKGGLYSSSDFGKNWNFIGLKNEYILTVHKVGNNLFAGTGYNGVFLSSDNGKTWEQRNNGLEDYSKIFLNKSDKQRIPVYKILNIGNTLFMKNLFLYFSNDFGMTWKKIDFGNDIYVDYLNVVNNQLYLQLYILLSQDQIVTYTKLSTDLGQNWQEVNLPYYWNTNPEFIVKDNKIYCCNDNLNIRQSTDNGQTWASIYSFSKSNIISLGLYNNTFYAVAENGQVYYSNDDCKSFSSWNTSQLENGTILNKAIISKEIIGYVDDIRFSPYFSNDSRLFTLKDRLSPWVEEKFSINAVGNAWSIHSNLGNLYTRTDNGIFKSPNQGENWSKPDNFPDLKIKKIDTIDSDKLVLVMDDQIAITNNSGQTWNYGDLSSMGKLSSIHFYPEIFVCSGLDSGIYYSTNQGISWQSFINKTNIKKLDEIFVKHTFFPEPYNETYYFAYNQNYGLILTNDLKNEWNNANSFIKFESSSWGLDYGSKMRDYTMVEDSLIDGFFYLFFLTEYRSIEPPSNNHFYLNRNYFFPAERNGNLEYSFKHYLNLYDDLHKIKGIKNVLFAFPKSGGLFYSTDYGDNWINKSSGAENVVVHDIIRAGDYLYIATTNGVYRDNVIDYPLSVKTELYNSNEMVVYPNPATEYITIDLSNYTLKGVVEMDEIRIFDIFGNEINPPRQTSSDTPQEGNKYRINISTLPAGMYFVKVGNEKPIKFVKM